MPKRRNRITPLQERFVAEYIVDLKPAQAAVRAGVRASNAASQAHKWLMKDHITEAITAAQKARVDRTQVTADMVVERLRQIVFTNITAIASWTKTSVELRPSAEIPIEMLPAIQEVTKMADGTIRVKLRDIQGFMTLLARHLGVIPIPGSARDPFKVDLTLKEDELDLSKFSDEELKQYHDVIGAIIEAQAITVSTEDPK